MRTVFVRRTVRAPLVFAALCAAGCIARPEGSYTPEERTVDPGTGDFADEAGVPSSDAGPRAGLPGSNGVIGTDAEGSVPAAMRGLLKLTGRYALKRQMHSVVKVEQSFARLEVENTTTHLSVAEIALDPNTGTLNMIERLCYQQYSHDCVRGCTTWDTDVDARVTRFFPYVERVITVRGGRFQSDIGIEGLGYDGKASDLPSAEDDARIWNVSGDASVREGVLTQIHAEGTPLGSVDCLVYTVQKFASSFAGDLKRGGLDGVTAALDTAGSEARRLGAAGASASTCEGDSGGTAPGAEPSSLRFTRVDMRKFSDDAFWNCPAASELEP